MNNDKLITNLQSRGFAVSCFQTKEDAVTYLSQEIQGKTVGIGGSMTIETMGLYDVLSNTNKVFWHWRHKSDETLRQAAQAQVYLTSANGVSETGEIVNIDGKGNRVAASLYGHEKLYIIIGTNKIEPTLEKAVWRARNIAAPLNAKRLKKQTPCALSKDMHCYDCRSPQRVCGTLTVMEYPMTGIGKTEIVIIEEELGF